MKNELTINQEPGSEAAAAAAGEALNNFLAENRETPVLLMLSAGSALSLLDYVGQKSLGENLTVAVLDERFSTDEKTNNFARLQHTDFYAMAMEVEVSFFGSLPRPGETMHDLAARMEKNLRTWKSENPHGIIVATLGMGKDGHTAGIFPFSDAEGFNKMFAGENWVAICDVGAKHEFHLRVTATAFFF